MREQHEIEKQGPLAGATAAGIDDLRVLAAFALSAVGQVATFAAYRWSMVER